MPSHYHPCDLPGCPLEGAPAIEAIGEALWEEARARRDGYPANDLPIEYINGWEDAATFLETGGPKRA